MTRTSEKVIWSLIIITVAIGYFAPLGRLAGFSM